MAAMRCCRQVLAVVADDLHSSIMPMTRSHLHVSATPAALLCAVPARPSAAPPPHSRRHLQQNQAVAVAALAAAAESLAVADLFAAAAVVAAAPAALDDVGGAGWNLVPAHAA